MTLWCTNGKQRRALNRRSAKGSHELVLQYIVRRNGSNGHGTNSGLRGGIDQ
jgi:hypothetical protein